MKKTSLLIVLCLVIFACSKEELSTEEELIIEPFLTETFVYENNDYTIQFDVDGNPITANVSEKMIEAITSSNVVQVDNLIYLFDDLNDMNEFISEKAATLRLEGNEAKAGGIAASTGYQHENLGGFPLGGTNNFAYPSLRPHGFDNLISSCIMFNQTSRPYLAQYYANENYGGRVFSVILSQGETRLIQNMRSVGLHDKVSSMIGRFL